VRKSGRITLRIFSVGAWFWEFCDCEMGNKLTGTVWM
jgi:hypothetical protein